MNEAREGHGCTTTTINGLKTVLVVGGRDQYLTPLKTMELYDTSTNEWKIHSWFLPNELEDLQVLHSRSLKYFAYLIGGYYQWDYDKPESRAQSAIYGWNRKLKWELVGNLKQKRYAHASLNLRKNDLPGCK